MLRRFVQRCSTVASARPVHTRALDSHLERRGRWDRAVKFCAGIAAIERRSSEGGRYGRRNLVGDRRLRQRQRGSVKEIRRAKEKWWKA